MLNALKSKENGCPQISAGEAFGKLNGALDWGSTQRRQGWICPYCRQPVFLKGAHLRHRKGRAARVDAHFCHYSMADDLLCILFKPNKSQESSTETIQGVAHHQILSLFYSLPSQEETSSWHNDLIRQEALSLAWLLDSLEIGSIEEDEQSFTWPVGMRRLPKAPEHLLRRLKHKDLFRIGLRSFGLIELKPLANGPLSVKARPNAIRKFFVCTGKERRYYFARIIASGQLSDHLNIASQLTTSLIEDKDDKLLWRQGYTSSLRLMAELLRKAVLKEQSTSPVIDVCSYIYFLPLIRPQKPNIEVIGHKSLSKCTPGRRLL